MRLKVSEMDNERLQYEKKLKSTKVSFFLKKKNLNVVCHSVSNIIKKMFSN